MAREWVGEVVVMIDGVTYRGTWKVNADGLLTVTHGRDQASALAQKAHVQEQAAAVLAELVGRRRK